MLECSLHVANLSSKAKIRSVDDRSAPGRMADVRALEATTR